MRDKNVISKRLKLAREAAGFHSVKEAAESLGINYATYAGHENGSRDMTRSIEQYARRFNVSVDWLLSGRGSGPNAAKAKETGDSLPEIRKSIDQIPVTGKVAANTWLDVDDMDFGHDDVEYVPSLSGYDPADQFALRVSGNCLNKIALDGDVLVCVRTPAGIDVEENSLVIVERRRYQGQMVERTAKRLRRSARGLELWPESTDPMHQDPIALYDVPENLEVEVIGKVIWVLRKP